MKRDLILFQKKKPTLQVLHPAQAVAKEQDQSALLEAASNLATSINELSEGLKVAVNAFTGNPVTPEVVAQVQVVRAKLDPNAPQPQLVSKPSHEVAISTEQATQQATEMLTGKNEKEAQTIITQAAKSGKTELVAAMVEAVTKETPDKDIPKVGQVRLKAAYHESLASANEAPNKMKQNSIKNACGKIATKANINHAAQASKGGDMSR